MQVAGLSSTKLLGPHILPPAQAYELGGLAGKWAIELCVILLGEVMAGFLVPQRNPLISQRSFPERLANSILLCATPPLR